MSGVLLTLNIDELLFYIKLCVKYVPSFDMSDRTYVDNYTPYNITETISDALTLFGYKDHDEKDVIDVSLLLHDCGFLKLKTKTTARHYSHDEAMASLRFGSGGSLFAFRRMRKIKCPYKVKRAKPKKIEKIKFRKKSHSAVYTIN